MNTVEYARMQLQYRHEELCQRLGSIEHSRRQTPAPRRRGGGKQAGDELLERLGEATGRELKQVLDAIERFRAGQYGRCECCDQPIADARLRLTPEATRCASCAQLRVPDAPAWPESQGGLQAAG